MDPVTEKMATGYAGSLQDSKNTKQPSPRKLPRLLKARMGICATEAPRAKGHSSGTCELSFTVVLCLEAGGVHTLGRRLNRGGQPTGKRQQPLPPETSADANLRCFLFKNFIQLDVKIDPRATSELCDLLWSPPRKSPLVTRTRDSVVLHSQYVKRNNTTLLIHVHCAPGTALGTFIFSKPHDTNLTSIIITPKWQMRKLRLRS